MKRLGSVAIISLLAALPVGGCDNASRLDKSVETGKAERGDKAKPEAVPAPAAKLDRSGTVEERVARLEDNYAKYAEALDFLGKVYAQQKAQQQQQEREEPAPDATFAIDVAPDVKLGTVEGPPQALVTIVEAWDFA